MKDKKVIIDTNIFVNPDSFKHLGKNPEEALSSFLLSVEACKNIKVYVPPSVFVEMEKFIKLDKIESKLLSLISKKPPSKYEIFVPAMFLYEFVEETRFRTNKGLRIVEKYIGKASKSQNLDDLIRSSRQEYRVAMREGIVDSREDIDLIVLAKELKALLATSDQGLIKWADKMGIEVVSVKELKSIFTLASSQKKK